ncbi:Ditrans,polycis-undecaprenyl-diphosphate synthase ((2E,6E)-farnesyl-diphosphate specific) [Methyloligella halotolerans]|uniref:Isoprenyl transferase n=1 Tax=Methyloligella halotolerans TaxID=1177755 RepID=A0A1E2RW99_9HYPH|nr:di-trans,poly-cis-decaprenylcistransferase [Methyloligella halotolerans]ODA66491.1 Ditrans,polycis-undecaprenyl-diphosphate synthase ((2E,6E)-farnesyl-diphosphate specific) [Methyloligella halotolerans]
MQSALQGRIHIGVIMDGNGRWAEEQGLPRSLGHQAGVRAVRSVIEAALEAGVGTLTLYAFSSDNWCRPRAEIAVLMRLLQSYLDREVASLKGQDIRLSFIGRRERLARTLLDRITWAEGATAECEGMHLRVAVDYSGRDAIQMAARQADAVMSRAAFGRLVTGDGAPDVDLLIRTGGEKRLSDFLLWECAYAELLFTDCMWPDFGPDALNAALAEFGRRQRRFGGLAPDAQAA